MATSGLSRRRVGGITPSSSTFPDDDDDDIRRSTTPSNSDPSNSSASHSRQSTNTGGGGGGGISRGAAGSAFERGSKIAYDPRDLDGANENETLQGGKLPKLTIMEEVLLLGIKDKQGYLSFWNDNISYALRGCILIELALRRRIALVKDANRRRVPLPDRLIEVIDDRQTGETILDEALKMIKAQEAVEKMGINSWIDLLSGETWNMLKYGFQLKQVRERLAKGLVDKGVLRTEKRNFLLFDMATHPVADVRTKEGIINRVVSLLTFTTTSVPETALDKEGTQCRTMRSVCLVCAAYAASVLDNAFGRLPYEEREVAFQRCDDILVEFASWPLGSSSSGDGGYSGRRRQGSARIGEGSRDTGGRESILGLLTEVRKEGKGEEDTGFELIAGVLEVLSKLDSLL